MKGRNVWLLAALLFAALLALPLLIPGNYTGSDGAAAALARDTGAEPWFTPIYEPPSGEVESLLFAAQAAAGGALLGYYAGRLRSREN